MKNCHNHIFKQEILSEKMSEQKSETFRINCLIAMFINRNLTNMSMKFILPLNIIIFEMIILTNVIFVTTVFKTISTFLNILKMFIIQNKRIYRCNFCTNSFDTKSNYKFTPITFTKLSIVIIVKKLFTCASHMRR